MEQAQTTLYRVAARAARAHTEPQVAIAAAVDELDAMPSVRRALLGRAVRDAMTLHVGRARHWERWKGKFRMRGLDAIEAADAALTSSILDWWIVRDKCLGDCTAADLRDEAAVESGLAAGHGANARFYTSLAVKVGRGKVRRLGADAVAQLWQDIADRKESAA